MKEPLLSANSDPLTGVALNRYGLPHYPCRFGVRGFLVLTAEIKSS